ncbi:TMAO reductase system periplasmic protein TorT [Photobacterium sp. BZF1]|uniref:TMAO reductase system periplasmic protein TorT n=1 Tax=Photobacterium sp. BZF1 TaxID=1904457 RepID=UPI0016536D85|nr:TMAO reductase system periplasmic protein TorT [Photobacterium sp. BZF1]MBC7005890.1 TMAO reductase system periplasmic protein TorT [Photobacterium sp. BZF1]
MIKKFAVTLLTLAGLSQTANAVDVIAYTPPFEADKQATNIQYQPLATANQPWKLCAVYPHLKDSYWLSVNYGMVEHAKKLGVELKVLEAGGYPNLTKQQSQLADCRTWNADAIILGTVDSLAYENMLTQLTDDIPVFATINYLDTSNKDSHDNVIARVGVDWYQMGYQTGKFLAKRHPKGSGVVTVALLPGPQKRGGTKPVVQGFYDATENSDINIVTTMWADHSKELQRNLIQQLLASDQHFDYIVGGAVAAEVAISELRANHLSDETKILSTYLSHGVYRGLLRGKILFAPTDKMAQQAMLSVDQAVRYLEGKPVKKDLAPILALLTPENLDSRAIAESLSPAEFRPVFRVEAPDT